MVDYNDIEEGKSIVTGTSIEGKLVTGICTNNMKVFRMINVKYGEDRLEKDFINYDDIQTIKK